MLPLIGQAPKYIIAVGINAYISYIIATVHERIVHIKRRYTYIIQPFRYVKLLLCLVTGNSVT